MSGNTQVTNNNHNNGNEDDHNTNHQSHHLFCELDELQTNRDNNLEWKEAARWIKFEENVENGGRWSKPHVATLSLHALLEVRNSFANGTVLLDLNAYDLTSIVEAILEEMISSGKLDASKRDQMKQVLLSRHLHQHEKEFRKLLDQGEKLSLPLIKSLADMGKKSSKKDVKELEHNLGAGLKANDESKSKDILSQMASNLSIATNASRINQNFFKKIPQGAETSNILVGEVDFLDQQIVGFVRLLNSVVLNDVTEVPVPTRFIFILLGPKGHSTKYREIGRSIATLMTDEIFDDFAYSARTRQDLLAGLDKFLDQVTVLPPGEWNPNIRLDPPKKLVTKEKRLNGGNGSTGDESEEHSLVSPMENDPTLVFTGRFCGGLWEDIKRKAPWYWSDFKDCLNLKCLSSVLFMYFACLSPIITFGGLLGDATDRNMAAIESLVSGAVCGISYHLFAGQPMTIIGSTGPVLVFETILNKFSKANDIDYMGFRAWIGLWVCLILLIIVITDMSFLVKYITRFTEECFAILIAFIFIKEAFMKLFEIRKLNNFSNEPGVYLPVVNNQSCWECRLKKSFENFTFFNSSAYDLSGFSKEECRDLGLEYEYVKKCVYVPDVFFFSCVLFMLTFLLAMGFRFFKTSRFLPATIRSKIGDFGVVATIAIVVTLDFLVGLDTPKLQVPAKFETTRPERGWFINPIERNKDKWWLSLIAIIPALLATILIFMDQHITSVIVNRRENKLKKSCGYHLDLLVIALCIGFNSLFGIPWFVAATVLSINHVISLKKESESAAPGEKPQFLGIVEQRVTGIIIFILIGCSIFMTKLLQFIPMPVLYGIFLYMGISSISGIQFVQRMLIVFMPEKYQPDYVLLRHVRTLKVHLFTLIQLSCLVMLFVIKMNGAISILFPLMVLALVFVRKLMDYFFTQKELCYLDDVMPSLRKKKQEEVNASDNSVENLKSSELDSIDISSELPKTNIWRDIVNSTDDMHKTSSHKKRIIRQNIDGIKEDDTTKPLMK